MIFIGFGLILVGVALIAAEVFLPSGGLLTVLAAASAVAGVVMLFREAATWGVAGVLTAVVLLPVTFVWAVRTLPHTPFGKAMGVVDEEAARLERQRAEDAERAELDALIGLEGHATTHLRPSGTVEIGGRRYDAVAELELLDLGERVRISRVEQNHVVVRAAR